MNSVIFSRERFKRSLCQVPCAYFTTLVATVHYNKRSVKKIEKKIMFISGKPLWPCSFKGTYLFHRTSWDNFCLKRSVLNV